MRDRGRKKKCLLRGRVSVWEIFFVGQCEVFVLILVFFFFPREAHRSVNGVSIL